MWDFVFSYEHEKNDTNSISGNNDKPGDTSTVDPDTKLASFNWGY